VFSKALERRHPMRTRRLDRKERIGMLLENKNAIIYGGGGKVGGAVARVFAREGASVFLAGRTLKSLEAVAEEIRSAGGAAETAEVDALDEQAVDRYVDAVAQKAGGIDVSFNLISYADVQGTPLAEMPLEDFERPVMTAVRTQFLTSRAAARHMIRQGSGVILTFGGPGGRDPIRDYTSGGFQVYLGGFQVALGAIDVLRRQLAVELGPHGIRVVTLQSGGVPETTREDWREAITQSFIDTSMLKRVETLEDVGNVAAFAASDLARTMTATDINITCGRVAD
jgi:3-oxoacyl-[acyl-carrier protein] reductase